MYANRLIALLLILLSISCVAPDPTQTVSPTTAAKVYPTMAKVSRPSPSAPEPPAGTERVLVADNSILLYVPSGDFIMGSKEDDPLSSGGEYPQHTVYLEGFWIGKHEVTNAQYRRFILAGGYSNPAHWTEAGWKWREEEGITRPHFWDDPQWSQDDHPVVGIRWFEAVAYANWAGARLPTEEEWEKAARGTDGRTWPWGNFWDGTRVNACDRNCDQRWRDESVNDGYQFIAPVDSYPEGASPYGALNMAGNVWEWCSTAAREDSNGYRNDNVLEGNENRALRGGSYDYDLQVVRCAYRSVGTPRYHYSHIGFRLATSNGALDP